LRRDVDGLLKVVDHLQQPGTGDWAALWFVVKVRATASESSEKRSSVIDLLRLWVNPGWTFDLAFPQANYS
jgi:hypothetical protein